MLSDAEKESLPKYSPTDEYTRTRKYRQHRRAAIRLALAALLIYTVASFWTKQDFARHGHDRNTLLSIDRLVADYGVCAKLRTVPEDPSGPREQNARYAGGKAVLIKNATVWTGEPALGTTPEAAHEGEGFAWIQSDVLLEHGLIKRVESNILESELDRKNLEVYHANGRQLTSGIVDMHSHTGKYLSR